MTDKNWSHFDFRHMVFQPKEMSAEELQAGADWLIAGFYRLDRVLLRCVRNLLTFRWIPAFLGLKLGLTYRYDIKRGKIIGWNPAEGKKRTADPHRFFSIREDPRLEMRG